MSLTAHLYTVELTANVRKPWMNYVNNGLKQYLIIGAVICYEYSNIWYLHFIISNTPKIVLGDKNYFCNYIFALFYHIIK